MSWFHWTILPVLLLIVQAEINEPKCESTPLQVFSVFDITISNIGQFREQQNKLIDTLRHLDKVTKGRQVNYALVVYHRLSVSLTPLNANVSGDLDKVVNQIETLSPRYHPEKSSVQALRTVIEQISSNGQPGVKSLILLTHSDGLTSDSLPDILDTKLKLAALNASIFVIANQRPTPSLLHYTKSKEQVYSKDADLLAFYNAIDSVIGACLDDVQPNGVPTHKVFGVRSSNAQPTADCPSNQVDLMIVLDTSGSIQRTFEREKNLAVELVNGLDRQSFGSKLQVSVIQFAAEPSLVVGFRQHATKQLILDRLHTIQFTGRITRIAQAVELGLQEMNNNGNKNSTKIFVLISDANSLDYWHNLKETGESLRQSGANVFVASTSSEINFDEMLVYAGDSRNIFIGARDKIFPIAVSALIQKCLNTEVKSHQSTFETKLTLTDQFSPLQKVKTHSTFEKPITGTLPNEAQPPAESFFTKVRGPKKEEAPSQIKHFDDNSNRNLFNDLSNDEIIANTTEIDENEFAGSGQEIKLDESVVQLISTVQQQQQETLTNESAPNCKFDLLFMVEGNKIEEQLSVAHKLVDRIPEALIPGQVNLLLILNGKIETSNSKPEFLETLQNANSTQTQTHPTQLIESINAKRRSNSQLLLLALSTDKAQNSYIDQIVNQLNPQYAFTLSSSTNTASVHLSKDSQELNQQTIDLLLPCISASVEQKFNEFVNAGRNTQSALATLKPSVPSVQNVPQPIETCDNDPIEFFIVLSGGTHASEEALKAKLHLLNNLPVFEQPKRIRVSVTVIVYTNEAKLLVPLGSSQQKSDSIQRVIEQLERSENVPPKLSLVAGLKLALTDILPSKRPRARLIGLLVVDENLMDQSNAILDIYQTLKGTQADVNVLFLGNEQDRNLTLQYVGGDSSKIYTQPEKFIEDAQTQLFNCQNETRVYAKIEDTDVFDEKISDLFRRSENSVQQSEASLITSECKEVDFILVVDTSTSVEAAYNRQLQFALDLVKHLPDHGLESGQIQLGIVSFYVQARGELPLGSLRQKDAIMDAISSIKHTGGSTFIANGLKLAIEMARKRTRPNSKLAIVLISDGNSQDEWQTVLSTAAQLRLLNADLYALTASHDFFFRELEIYADKNIFTDTQFDNFLAKIDSSMLIECSNGTSPALKKAREQVTTINPTTAFPTTLSTQRKSTLPVEECNDDQVDLMLVLDTSTSTASQFYSQRKLVHDLIKILPLDGKRVQVALVHFNTTSKLHFGFSSNKSQSEILHGIQQVNYTGGETSLFAGVEGAFEEIEAHSRQPKARLIVLLVSAGNSRDGWTQVQTASKKLRQLKNANVYAVTLSSAYYFDELREYTNNEHNIYADERTDDFIQDIGQQILSCESDKLTENKSEKPTVSLNKDPKTEFAARDEKPVVKNEVPKDECTFAKIDLILILDASTSRESVFEHQRELALSLIERLPISRGDTHVSIGLNSFVHVPTMRLTLGLGRDRTMVRKAIEEIEFKGGSTLTSQAIELAIKDLEKGRRRDAVQIIVLFNDGMSQDKWETVEETGHHLSKANAELFGVALGDNVDLRELQLYIKRKERIYRDGAAETERFLQDVVSLLRNDTSENCPLFFNDPEEETASSELPSTQIAQLCEKPKFDIVALFDNSDNTVNMSDPKLNSNRYLLLDVLGSLPLGSQVHVAVFSFGQTAQLEFDLTSEGEKEVLVEKVEAIQAKKGRPSYATAVTEALEYYKRNHRSNARGLLLIVGDGQNTTDGMEARSLAANQIRRTNNLLCQAVSSNDVDLQTLIAYTGSISNVFNYDRNAEFAKTVLQLATATSECQQPVTTTKKPVQPKDTKDLEPLRDIAASKAEASDKTLFSGDSEKLLKKSTVKLTTTPAPTVQTEQTKQTTKAQVTTVQTKENVVKIEKSTKSQPSTTATTQTTTTTLPSITKSTKTQTTTLKPKPSAKLTNITTNCAIDLMLIIDVSGSVNETLQHAKNIGMRLVEEFDVGPNNTHISIIKFASKARTLHSFDESQEEEDILRKLDEIHLTVGSTTAIHTALLQAISEYTAVRGARLNKAQSLAIIFTDGFAQKDMSVEAGLLRSVASLYAVGINHDYPISRKGLEELTGDSKRVFTDRNIDDFLSLLKQHLAKCRKN